MRHVMSAPSPRRRKSPLQEWLVAGRKSLAKSPNVGKPDDLARELAAAGYNDGQGVTEGTVRGWEAPVGSVPLDAIPYLRTVFRRHGFTDAPPVDDRAPDQASVAAAIDRQTDALKELAKAIRDVFTQLDVRSQSRSEVLLSRIESIAATVGAPSPEESEEPADVLATRQIEDAEPDHQRRKRRSPGAPRSRSGRPRTARDDGREPAEEARSA